MAGELAARAFELSAAATELAVEVRTYRERLELDPARLHEVRERIGALDALQRKYGKGEEGARLPRRAAESLDALAGVEQERERAAAEVAERTERVALRDGGLGRSRPRGARARRGAAGGARRARDGGGLDRGHPRPEPGAAPGGAEHAAFVFSGAPSSLRNRSRRSRRAASSPGRCSRAGACSSTWTTCRR